MLDENIGAIFMGDGLAITSPMAGFATREASLGALGLWGLLRIFASTPLKRLL
jgi:hypothetical protein